MESWFEDSTQTVQPLKLAATVSSYKVKYFPKWTNKQ